VRYPKFLDNSFEQGCITDLVGSLRTAMVYWSRPCAPLVNGRYANRVLLPSWSCFELRSLGSWRKQAASGKDLSPCCQARRQTTPAENHHARHLNAQNGTETVGLATTLAKAVWFGYPEIIGIMHLFASVFKTAQPVPSAVIKELTDEQLWRIVENGFTSVLYSPRTSLTP
jgi:hypothetical protein